MGVDAHGLLYIRIFRLLFNVNPPICEMRGTSFSAFLPPYVTLGFPLGLLNCTNRLSVHVSIGGWEGEARDDICIFLWLVRFHVSSPPAPTK